jgi:hypothetical protein
MRRERKIFSGHGHFSRMLWRDINRTSGTPPTDSTAEALYCLACGCQQLESRVERLREELAKVKRGIK